MSTCVRRRAVARRRGPSGKGRPSHKPTVPRPALPARAPSPPGSIRAPTDVAILAICCRCTSVFAFGAFALAACGVGDRSRAGGLTYFLTADPASLDPAASNDVQSGEMVALLFDNLVQFDVNAGLEPGLAERGEVDATGTVYTFHLRSNARFHDGRAVNGRVVRTSMLRALAPGSGAARVWPLLPIKGAREYAAGTATTVPGMAVPDDSTIVFT